MFIRVLHGIVLFLFRLRDTTNANLLKFPTDSQYYRSNSSRNATSCEITTRTKSSTAVISCLLHSQRRRREERAERAAGRQALSLNVFDETRLLINERVVRQQSIIISRYSWCGFINGSTFATPGGEWANYDDCLRLVRYSTAVRATAPVRPWASF